MAAACWGEAWEALACLGNGHCTVPIISKRAGSPIGGKNISCTGCWGASASFLFAARIAFLTVTSLWEQGVHWCALGLQSSHLVFTSSDIQTDTRSLSAYLQKRCACNTPASCSASARAPRQRVHHTRDLQRVSACTIQRVSACNTRSPAG